MIRENKITPGHAGFERALRKACEGVYYTSESDAEIVPFFGVKTVNGVRKTLLKEIQVTGSTPIEEVRPAEFFSRLTTIKDWYSKADIKNAMRYEKIEKLLEENLHGLAVLRIGRIRIDIYVAGIDKSGHLCGIKTKAVET